MEWKEPHPQRLPTPAEITDNLIKIQEAKKRVQELTLQIEELQKARIEAQQDHDNRVSFIAPFRRLPEEILREIATYCRETEEGLKLWEFNSINKATRIAINGMKSLWSTIWIKPRRVDNARWANAIPCVNINHLRLILERAAPAPLTIILETVESQMYREILPYDGNITKLILSDSAGRRQWSSPYFSELPELKLTSLQTFIAQGNHAHDFPILRFLTMASHSQCTNMSLHFALPDAREMSNLMELQVMQRVITLTIKFDNQGPQIPQARHSISHLETLDLSGRLELLSFWDMPKLRALRVYDLSSSIRRHHIPSTLEDLCLEDLQISHLVEPSDNQRFTRLTSLTIRGVHWNRQSDQYFDMPRLEELTLSKISQYQFHSNSLIGRDRVFGHLPSLKRLWAEEVTVALMDNFLPCPNLVALRITDCRANDALVDLLINDLTSVPQLEEFFFKDSFKEHIRELFEFGVPPEVEMQKWANKRPGLRIIAEKSECRHRFRVDIST